MKKKYSVTSIINKIGDIKYQITGISDSDPRAEEIKYVHKKMVEKNPRRKRLTTKVLEL